MIVSAVLIGVMAVASAASAAEGGTAAKDATVREGALSLPGVYLAVGLAAAAGFTAAVSIMAAGFAVGKIGAAALGSAAEHPELLTRSLLFVALAEGLAVLGFAVAMLIVMKIP